MQKCSLSVCLILRNQDTYFENWLSNISDIASEIIIVNLGSSIQIKKQLNDCKLKIYDFKFNNNFSEAKNKALE
mgnify:FL=1